MRVRWRARVMVTGFVANDRSRSAIAVVVFESFRCQIVEKFSRMQGQCGQVASSIQTGLPSAQAEQRHGVQEVLRVSALDTLRALACAFDMVWQPIQEPRLASCDSDRHARR